MTKTTRITANINGEPRRLITLVEEELGDVYLELQGGVQIGLPPDNILICQQKYSIHASPTSKLYNSIKTFWRFSDNQTKCVVNLTNAVKSKNGFGLVFVGICTSMQGEAYNVNTVAGDETVNIATFHKERATLAVGVFVGDKNVQFTTSDKRFGINSIRTDLFNIVIAHTLVWMPSSTYGDFLSFGTLRPEEAEGELAAARLEAMQSVDPILCLDAFDKIVQSMAKKIIEKMLRLAQS